MPSQVPVSPRTAYVLMALTAVFWAGNFVVGRAASGTIPPLSLAWARWTGAALLLLPFAVGHLRADWPAIRRHAGLVFLLGCMGAGIFNTLQYVALTTMTAVTGAVINSAGPVLIALACWVILGDRLNAWQVLGIAISLAGVLVVVMRGDVSRVPELGRSVGELLMLLGLIVWAAYTALLRFRPRIHPLSFAAATYIVAAIVNTPTMLWELSSGAVVQLNPTTLAAIGYVSIFPSLLAYLFFNAAVESIGGARAGAFFHLTPLMTAVLAMIFLGETFAFYHVASFALIAAGLWLTATRGG